MSQETEREELDPNMWVTFATVVTTRLKHTRTIERFLETMPDTKLRFLKTSINRLRIVEEKPPVQVGEPLMTLDEGDKNNS